jgi:hypothetical protein
MKEGTRRSLSFIEPMKALPVEKLPEGDWLYEINSMDTGRWFSRTARMCGSRNQNASSHKHRRT